jgi:hypothetical protein
MRAVHRLALLTVLTVVTTGTFGATVASASTINVAEFRWDTLDEFGAPCAGGGADPLCLSIFTLTNIWDGPAPGATLFNNRLSLPSGDQFFFDLAAAFPFQFDQLAEVGIPAFAATSVSFLFGGDLISLGVTLTQPDTFAVLQFTPGQVPVPEPGTFGLVLLGTTFLVRHVRRRK